MRFRVRHISISRDQLINAKVLLGGGQFGFGFPGTSSVDDSAADESS